MIDRLERTIEKRFHGHKTRRMDDAGGGRPPEEGANGSEESDGRT